MAYIVTYARGPEVISPALRVLIVAVVIVTEAGIKRLSYGNIPAL